MKKVQDYYFKKAKRDGYPARSVYKLEEAQAKYGFLKSGQKVLELGAHPGSWTKLAARIVGPAGLVIAVDLQPLKVSAPNIVALTSDVFAMELDDLRRDARAFDVVLSDMAPKTSGRKDVDHLRSIALCERALDLAVALLGKDGVFFCKVFQGGEFDAFRNLCQTWFRSVKVIKPKSSRSESVETFLFCSGKKEKDPAAGG